MNDISVGAIGAASIAGLISLLSLIIGKEQKVSEFRQAWINDLRKCLTDYLVHINAISDALRLQAADKVADKASLLASYKGLNEASHGIVFRINSKEKPAKALLTAMQEFQELAKNNSGLTPENIKIIEGKFIKASKKLLKSEWVRVKRGENIFVWTKWASIVVVAGTIVRLLISFLFSWYTDRYKDESEMMPLSAKSLASYRANIDVV